MAEIATGRGHPSLVLGAARFYHDPRASIRGLLATRPSEGRLLAIAMTAAAMLLVGRLVQGAGTAVDPVARAVEQTVSLLFFVPLAYYLLAAVGTVIARACGGTGGWREGRTAFFWAALVSAPPMMLSWLAGLSVAGAPASVTFFVGQAGAIFFAWALAQCFAEAFGFGRPGWVLVVVVAPIAFGMLAVWALKS